MNPDTIKLLVSIGSVIFTGILVTFKEEILNFFRSGKYKYLKAKWGCKWKESPSAEHPNGQTIFDKIEITSVIGRLVKGKGYTDDYGDWEFKGSISKAVITMTYKNKIGSDRSGVFILKIDEDKPDVLDGVWCQYKRGDIASGTTEWIKAKK